MDGASCPRCGEAGLATGDCIGRDPAGLFKPTQIRFFRWELGVPLRQGEDGSLAPCFTACLSCGHVWGAVDPAALRSFLAKYGKHPVPEVTAKRPDRDERRITPSFPVVEPIRDPAKLLAALDQLVFVGKTADLPKHYRAMTGATWEEAAKVTREWRYRTREEKLQRLGWVGKPEKPTDDLAEPLL